MREWIDLVEATAKALLPVTPENVQRARDFVFSKWKQLQIERGRKEPTDLSSACKYSAVFAQAIFGGKIQAHDFHTWLKTDGKVIDLNDGAADVEAMKAGNIPDEQKSYAETWNVSLPQAGLYTHDPLFMRLHGGNDAVASVKPRIKEWVKEFMRA